MELTLPGFRHDLCSTILPLTLASPFFGRSTWRRAASSSIHPDAPFAHPLDDGRAAVLERSVAATARRPRRADGRAWRRLFGPLVREAGKLGAEILRPVVHVPRHPLALARFGLPALRSARGPGTRRFQGDAARALFAGVSAHAMLPLDRPLSAVVRAGPRDLRPRGRLADGPWRLVGRDDALVAELGRPAARS